MEYPKQRHIACRNQDCKICYEDAIALGDYLTERGVEGDGLSKYYTWLADNHICNDLFGWPSAESYKKDNIETFIEKPDSKAITEYEELELKCWILEYENKKLRGLLERVLPHMPQPNCTVDPENRPCSGRPDCGACEQCKILYDIRAALAEQGDDK